MVVIHIVAVRAPFLVGWNVFMAMMVTSFSVKAVETGRAIFAGWMQKREDNFSAQIKGLTPLRWYQGGQRPSSTRGLVFGRRSS